MCIQGNPKLREGHGQLETEIDVRRLGAAESMTEEIDTKLDVKFKLVGENFGTLETHMINRVDFFEIFVITRWVTLTEKLNLHY